MILNPAVTATVHGERPKLVALRDELSAWIGMLRDNLATVSGELESEHKEWASQYTQDLEWAQRHVDSAWRSLGYAMELVAGK